MGRKRQSNPLDLPERVYAKGSAFYFHHRPTEEHPNGRWEKLSTDVLEAKKRAAAINSNLGDGFGKMPYWLGEWMQTVAARVKAGTLAQRTHDDYKEAAEILGAWFGEFYPAGIDSAHVGEYLDKGLEMGRAVRANREKAALSVFFSWMMRAQAARPAGVKSNPCAGVRRNTETKRQRYVEDAEMVGTLAQAPVQVWGLAQLVYRTLQRPEDVITWTPRNITTRRDPAGREVKILRVGQAKSRRAGPAKIVDIEITPEIDAILAKLKAPLPQTGKKKPSAVITGMTLIHRRDGHPYTYDGLCSMLKRAQEDLRDLHTVKRGPLAEMPAWGFYDMKGKGATDMWQSGIPLTQIQVLCGHESVKTTEVYVKARWRGIVSPNVVKTAG